jgi:SAM-dependent methyltransferase
MPDGTRHDTWAVPDSYEAYMGRWSRAVARPFLGALPVRPGTEWLDVGCGTGALVQTILDVAAPLAVTGIDPSEAFVQHARAHTRDPRARFEVGDALALPARDASFDAVVSALVLNFVPEPRRMVGEMVRASRPGAVVALYVWDYAGAMELIRRFWDAATALDARAAALDEAVRFPISAPAPLARLFGDAGLRDVETFAIDVLTDFSDFDDYWSPFTKGQGPAPGYAASLSDERRMALRETLRASLPTASDGSIRLTARAWAVRGCKR